MLGKEIVMQHHQRPTSMAILEPIDLSVADPVPEGEVQRRRNLLVKVRARLEAVGVVDISLQGLIQDVRRDRNDDE